MSAYIVLARKWRSSQFSDVIGQTHIIRTLSNAIEQERIHQAYLFTGSRGIGKTSIARIFAKLVRCSQIKKENELIQSCDECPSCKEMALGSSVDVIEIDGASNNGVDAIREIRENAKYLPANGSRKVYIIDEVHMLTTAAFNALLKTLEEPPPHVIFIFATTEPHKIPATILSRCQRFDFRRHTVAQIQDRLQQILEAEKIEAEPGAMTLIASAAEGSMRDGLSLLDQVIAYSGEKISLNAVRESIGLIESETLLSILSSILSKKPVEGLKEVDAAYQQGHDLKVLTRSLIELLHAAILLKVGASSSQIVELSEEHWGQLKKISQLRPIEELELIFQVLHHGMDSIARSTQPKVILDILLIKCATAEILVSVSAQPSHSTKNSPPTKMASKPNSKPKPQQKVLKTAPQPAPPTPQADPQMSPSPSDRSWSGFIEYVRKSRPLLASILEYSIQSQLPTQEKPELHFLFNSEDAFKAEQLNSPVYRGELKKHSESYFAQAVSIQVGTQKQKTAQKMETLAQKKKRILIEKETAAKNAVQNHPIIQEAKSLFGGKLGPIKIAEDATKQPSSQGLMS